MSLVQELIKELLPDNQIKVGVYGGGFKPPTKGHFEVVKTALEQNKDIDILYIFVGKGERDGVTQDDAMNVWGIYKNYLPSNVKIVKATKTKLAYWFSIIGENWYKKLYINSPTKPEFPLSINQNELLNVICKNVHPNTKYKER